MNQASTKKMAPGDDMHLTLLMAPHNLNLVTGQDRQHLLAFGRAAFEAGQKCQGCSVPPNGLHQIAEPSHSMSQYASKDDMLKAVMAENEQLRAQLAAVQQGAQPVAWLAEYVDREGNSKWYVSTHKDLATENDMHEAPKPLYTHPTPQGLSERKDRDTIFFLAGWNGCNEGLDANEQFKKATIAAQAKQGGAA